MIVSQKKLIIFDMDGTLVDSSGVIAGAINHVRKNLMLPPMDKDKIIANINNHSIDPLKYFYNLKKFDPMCEKWFSEFYSQNHNTHLVIYEGIADILKFLRSQDIKLAVATNAYRQSTLESLKHLGIYDFFDAIACYDDVGEGKPSPKMLEMILGEMRLDVAQSLFVGDGERDAMAAQRAKMDYIMVEWGFSSHEDAVSSVQALQEKLVSIL
ncbi:MAG: HAD family hydrolase [Campylobacterales bacterium]|nr:HAD family hydrolase [Campylobacterales bacterium]